MRISDWSSDGCSSDLSELSHDGNARAACRPAPPAGLRAAGYWPVDPGRDSAQRAGNRSSSQPRGNEPRDRHLSVRSRQGRIVDTQERGRSEEHTSELQSLMRISYAVFCLKKTKK